MRRFWKPAKKRQRPAATVANPKIKMSNFVSVHIVVLASRSCAIVALLRCPGIVGSVNMLSSFFAILFPFRLEAAIFRRDELRHRESCSPAKPLSLTTFSGSDCSYGEQGIDIQCSQSYAITNIGAIGLSRPLSENENIQLTNVQGDSLQPSSSDSGPTCLKVPSGATYLFSSAMEFA